ncbi:sugar ABC transporter permease [Halanaerobacter jeridensis]|uniref:Xylose transport system permease protein XylH n=1 Tax=Halanaerobacter jeridensis TaxID=706427 RepID=A0A938XNF5_9FIRM|nr:sugar ABC transporter permease [Halanaerobacter jeridensis]MBM7555658.1 D-xylose transport system permease protein [Halanaerobacter jeridensis]
MKEAKKEEGFLGLKKSNFNFDIKTYMMVIALVGIWVVFTFLTKGTFLTSRNLSNLFRQSVITSVLAVGMVLVIILGEVDLSVGSVLGLCGGIVGILDVWVGLNPFLTIVSTLVIGMLIGLWNGWWIAYRGVPSLIVTLGGLLGFRGVLLGVTGGTTISPLSKAFNYLGSGYLPEMVSNVLGLGLIAYIIYYRLHKRKKKKEHGFEVSSLTLEIIKIVLTSLLVAMFVMILNSYQGIPVLVIVLLVAMAIFTYITKNTVFGRHIYAIGGNEEAAELSGIELKKSKLIIFMLNGLMAAIAGILLSSRLNAASVSAGDGAELDAIAACVIGGASLAGGIGNVLGAVVGAVVMASLDNGMSLMGAPMYWQQIVKGLVLVLAVWFDVATRNKGE